MTAQFGVVVATVAALTLWVAGVPEVARAAVGSDPARVAIPTIGIDTPLVPLGIEPSGRMAVPTDYDTVGWFTGGGRPGGPGPVVIAAHVDGPAGPAAFYRLPTVAVGDPVSVTDAAGASTAYRVTAVTTVAKTGFPTAQVFGATPGDALRLITCGGFFDPNARSYDQNVVVFAEPA